MCNIIISETVANRASFLTLNRTGLTKGDSDELAYWLQADLKEAAKLISEWFSVFKES